MELVKKANKYQIVGMDALDLKRISNAIHSWNEKHMSVGRSELCFELPFNADLEPELDALEIKH